MEPSASPLGTNFRRGRILREGCRPCQGGENLEPGLQSTARFRAPAGCGIADAVRGASSVGRILLTAGQQVEGLGAIPAGAIVTGTWAREFGQEPE
jgi:hypothetical protein